MRRRHETGRYQGHFHRMSSRFLRRRYVSLLKEYIPVISEREGKVWVERANVSNECPFPPVEARHMRGYVMSCGTKVGQVNDRAAFITPPFTIGRDKSPATRTAVKKEKNGGIEDTSN